jgi:hypothetical protein
MTIYRARVSVDLLYEADKPLTSALLTRITNRTGTYIRTGGVEGLEEDHKIKRVIFDEGSRHQHTHHHDARYEQCRAELRASQDDLGPIE